MQSYPLKGGLDLRTGQAMVNPGTLADCLNYEVSDRDGYARIEGFERYDGQFHVADVRSVRATITASDTFRPGDEVQIGDTTCYVIRVSPGALDILCHSRDPWPVSTPATITNITQSGTATASAITLLPQPTGLQKDVNAARGKLLDAARPSMTPVPGAPDTPVSGVFWFKNRLYAIRDFPVVWFESAQQWPFQVGDNVTMPGGVYTVMAIHYTSHAYLAGYMTLWPLDVGSGESMAFIPQVGDDLTRPGDYVGADMAGAAMGELPMAMEGSLNYGDSKASVSAPTVDATPSTSDDLSLRTARRTAGLWKATSTGWSSMDLKREAQFDAGTAAFGTFIDNNIGIGAAPLQTSYVPGASAMLNAQDVTSKVAHDDATEAALSGDASDELWVVNPDLSAIPDTATILGIEVDIKRHADVGGKVRDGIVELVGIDGTSANKARVTSWDTTGTTITYGGAADTWSNNNLTPAIIKSDAFGVRLVTRAVDTTPSGGIDLVAIRVHYRRRDAAVYAWDGTDDVAVNLVDVQLINGNYADGDASGWLVLDIPGSTWNASVANGMQLRSKANGAGDLLATIASRDSVIHLPGWSDLQHNQSQYQFEVTNFYGMNDYAAVYGVSGASPAFTYDGTRLLWVRTPLDPHQDMPRHIARHGATLVLGYYPGAYILSQVGGPTNFRGQDGATSIEIGEHLTNLMPAMGDALMVTSQTQTYLLHGLSPTTYQQNTVSANRGALEYTAANVGRLLVTDSLGVAAADATPAFGDLSRTYVSMPVEQWLTPRLISTLGADSAHLQPICAMSVRRKNQYRLYFRDGYVMTMTSHEAPEFTLQRYFQPAATPDDEDVGFPISAVCTGIDVDGRERVFGSFDADAHRGYVVDLDSGPSFSGDPLPAYFVLNPLSFSTNMLLKRFDRMFLLGQAEGYASLSLSRSIDYEPPDPSKPWKLTFGPSSAKFGPRGARGSVDAPIEGFEISVRVDSSTATEGPHVVQAISTTADARGDSRGIPRN